MNGINVKCPSCKEDFMISTDELLFFKAGECSKCMKPMVRHFRNLAIYGYYDLKEIIIETANKIIERDSKDEN